VADDDIFAPPGDEEYDTLNTREPMWVGWLVGIIIAAVVIGLLLSA
jgi:hypothetical protein